MQIVSEGDNLHEMSNPIFLGKIRKYFKMSSAEILPSMQSVKGNKAYEKEEIADSV